MDKTERAEKLLTRFKELDANRTDWVPTWQELADYIMPRKDSFSGAGLKAKPRDEHIYDSTPMHALELLASAVGGILTNPAMPWFDIACMRKEKADSKDVRAYTTEAREAMLGRFNSEDTGFQTSVHELYLDCPLFGTGNMYVESDPDTIVRFSTRPLGEIFISESAQGRADTVFRKYELTRRQAIQEWGTKCSQDLRDKAEEKPEEKVGILHAVYPRKKRDPNGKSDKDFPLESIYLETQTKHILEEGGFMELPYMVPRWAKASGEIYGRGPGLTALSDVRVLNAMARTALMAAEKMSDPPLMVPDDGFLGPVRSGPGGLSYYRAGSSDRIEALPVNVDLGATEAMMEQRRESIRRIFMNDQITPEGPQMTATEALIRQSEKMRVLGPVLGRFQTEFLTPLIRRVFALMDRAGALPKLPDGMDISDFAVRYTSPIARAQKQYEAQTLGQSMEYLAPLVGEGDPFGIMDNFDTDRIARHVTELFGTPADYLRPEKDRDANRQQRVKDAQAQRELDRAGEMANIAKTASQADMGGDNAMTALLGKPTGGGQQ